ncbi:MAG: hypothetical protein HYY06_05230 [Deltaproteobacteria bacterium]|nr:hypothetical protein [Deltaproteobacteria bacterium]
MVPSARRPSHALAIVALWALFAEGCVGEGAKNQRAGVVAPGVTSAIDDVVLAWTQGTYPVEGPQTEGTSIPDPLVVWGRAPITDGAFDLDELVAPEGEAPDWPAITCLPPDSARLSLGLLLGVGSEVDDGDAIGLATFASDTTAYSDDVLAVYADRDVLPGSPEWYVFEMAIPAGISLQRHVPCDTFRWERCRPFTQLRMNCFEPLPPDAVVILNSF